MWSPYMELFKRHPKKVTKGQGHIKVKHEQMLTISVTLLVLNTDALCMLKLKGTR